MSKSLKGTSVAEEMPREGVGELQAECPPKLRPRGSNLQRDGVWTQGLREGCGS